MKKVLEKLKRHPNYTGMNFNEEDLTESARMLSDPKLFEEIYFKSNLNQAWRVKLVLSKIDLTAIKRKIFLKICFSMIKKSPFGNLYAALQIGPNLLAWDSGSLVLPAAIDDFRGYNAILTADIDSLDCNDLRDDLMKKVCIRCCEWNIEKSNSIASDHNQEFIKDLINVMELTPSYSRGALGNFMKTLISSRNPDEIPFGYGNEVFETHADLDNYCYRERPERGTDLYWLLKAFDRVMWSRYYAARTELENFYNEESYVEESEISDLEEKVNYYKPCDAGCFFGNPYDTGSIIGS